MPVNLENSAMATGLVMVSFHFSPKERQCQRMLKLPHDCIHLTASKVMVKILQARLSQCGNSELPDDQAGFSKGEEPEIELQTSLGSSTKRQSAGKTSTYVLLTMPKSSLCGSQQTVENCSRDGNTRPPDLPPEESVCRSRSNS